MYKSNYNKGFTPKPKIELKKRNRGIYMKKLLLTTLCLLQIFTLFAATAKYQSQDYAENHQPPRGRNVQRTMEIVIEDICDKLRKAQRQHYHKNDYERKIDDNSKPRFLPFLFHQSFTTL